MFDWISRILKPERSPGRRNTRKRKSVQKATAHAPYRAVSIVNAHNPCAAAKRIEGHIFLAAHAPTLPLGSCSNAHDCKCKYKHQADRRGGDGRRDQDIGLPDRPIQHEDRRQRRRDRRRQDKLSKVS